MPSHFSRTCRRLASLGLGIFLGGIKFAHAGGITDYPALPNDLSDIHQLVDNWVAERTAQLNADSKVITVPGFGNIEYTLHGTGPVVLCLHGGLGGYDQSALIGEHLIAAGFTVIGVSRPGYLRTPLVTSGPGENDTAELQADCMIALLDTLHIPKAAALGFSSGVAVAFQMEYRAADRPHLWAAVLEGAGTISTDSSYYQLVQDFISLDFYPDLAAFTLDWDRINLPEITRNLTLTQDTSLSGAALLARQNYVANSPSQNDFYNRLVLTLGPISTRAPGVHNDIAHVSPWIGPNGYLTLGQPATITTPTAIVQDVNDSVGNTPEAMVIRDAFPPAYMHYISVEGSGHFIWLGPNTAAWQADLAAFLQAQVPVAPATFAGWAGSYGFTGTYAQPGAKSFNDNVPNLMRYAMNLQVTDAPVGRPTPGTTVIGDVPCTTLEYRARKSMTDYTLVPQYSTNLLNWIDVASDDIMQLADADAFTARYQARAAFPENGLVFMRIEARSAPTDR